MIEKTVLWYTRCPALTASSIAIRDGWLERTFEPRGIAVRSLTESPDRAVHESHFSHSQSDSFRHGGNIPPIWSRSRGGDARLVGMTWGETPYAILTMPDSGIETVQDLAGKRLALPRRSRDSIDFARATHARTYDAALTAAGMTRADVEIVDLPVERAFLDDSKGDVKRGALWNAAQLRGFQRTEIFALINGKVDAIASSGYWIKDLAALLGVRVLFDSRSLPRRPERTNSGNPALLTVSGSLIDERPDLVIDWLTCLLEAARWGKAHLDETIRIAAIETAVPEAFVNEAGPAAIAACLDIGCGQALCDAVDAQKAYLLENGFIERDFDLQQWLEPALLMEAERRVARPR